MSARGEIPSFFVAGEGALQRLRGTRLARGRVGGGKEVLDARKDIALECNNYTEAQ